MNLKELFENGKYSEIIELTNKVSDAESISYRINALIAIENYKAALHEIEIHKEALYKKNPLTCMNLHIELLLHLKMYVEAINAHKEYSERPYISQQVEEFLRDIPNKIIAAQKRSEINNLYQNEEEVKKLFMNSKDEMMLSSAIYNLKKLDIIPYLTSLLVLLKRVDVSDDIKTLTLIMLVTKKVDMEVEINKNNNLYKVNPSKLSAPFNDRQYKEINNLISKISRDPTIENVAKNLFNQFILNSYPNVIYNDESNAMAVAFIALAKRYLKADNEVNEVILSNGFSINKIEELMNIFQNKIEKNK